MSSKVQQIQSAPGFSPVWLVSCDMGPLPLNADTYFARVYVGNGSNDVARFRKAFIIHIREHDVFGWGRVCRTSKVGARSIGLLGGIFGRISRDR